MSENSTGLKRVNLDKLLEEFNNWQRYTSEATRENVSLQEKVDIVQKLLSVSENREKILTSELQDLKRMINQLQGILDKRCDLDDENKKLRDEIQKAEENIQEKEKTHRKQISDLEATLADTHSAHQAEMQHQCQELKKQAEAEKTTCQTVVEEKNQKILNLQRQLLDMEREKQTEIVRLRLEYDAKLLKIQKQATKTQAAQGSTFNQDIFRKKLQHAKVESEREISGLKKTINELQQKLSTQEQISNPPPFKRSKRF